MMGSRIMALLLVGSLIVSVSAQEPIWDGNTVTLESKKLSDGVFAVIPRDAEKMAALGQPIATTAGFVIGSESVLVIDTMLNERLHRQLMTLIEAETNLPVRYAVNTSFHGDHSYGNQYLPDETLLIQHASTAQHIAENLDEDKAFMIQNFGKGRGIEEIQATAADLLVANRGEITIDLGGVRVLIRDYGFAQTGGDLFVSVPSANVVWTGNPIIAEAPALPWLLDGHLIETRDTLQTVYADFDKNTQVVPGHGPVTSIETIKWNIDYLNAVERQVKLAIVDGLTLEETVSRLTMDGFQGYALFNWVHPQLNVPAAYKDLQ